MPINVTVSGSAADEDIVKIEIVRLSDEALKGTVTYKAGTRGGRLEWSISEAAKTSIESLYTEIKQQINEAEGLT